MGPLAGVRIVEMSGIGPGPVCGMMLAREKRWLSWATESGR